MWTIPEKNIYTLEDAMQLLDALIPMKVDWASFYTEGKRQPPFLQNLPDENLVSYFDTGILSGGRVLELGCGPGRNAVYMARMGCEVRAIDLSQTAINRAKERAEDAGVTVDFSVGSVFDMLIESGQYDLVYDSIP